jgi:uncharacterized surface protein with fasciclin (FAS1) repeats
MRLTVGTRNGKVRSAVLTACVAGLAVTACGKSKDEPAAATAPAAAAAGNETLAAGLGAESRFAAAVKAAGLEPALAGPTPYTLLAPGDSAFDKLPAGEVDRLMKADARAELTAILTTHVLPGTMLAADIGRAIDASGGKAQIRTLGGGTLTATRNGERIQFTDPAGTVSTVTAADDKRSNGIIHHVDTLLAPGK